MTARAEPEYAHWARVVSHYGSDLDGPESRGLGTTLPRDTTPSRSKDDSATKVAWLTFESEREVDSLFVIRLLYELAC